MYDTSYTKKVVEHLRELQYREDINLQEAIDLLRQYHRDMRVPYEQRDNARAELVRYKALYEVAKATIADLRNPFSDVDCISSRPLPQFSFACEHHPSATSNLFAGRTGCIHGCEKEPLRWFDSGCHRELGK